MRSDLRAMKTTTAEHLSAATSGRHQPVLATAAAGIDDRPVDVMSSEKRQNYWTLTATPRPNVNPPPVAADKETGALASIGERQPSLPVQS